MTDSTRLPTPNSQAAPASKVPLAYRVVRGSLWMAVTSYSAVGCGFLANLIRSRLVGGVAFATYYVPALWLAVQGGGYWSLVAQNAVYEAILLVAMWWAARRRLPHIWRLPWRFNWPTGKYLLRFGATIGIRIPWLSEDGGYGRLARGATRVRQIRLRSAGLLRTYSRPAASNPAGAVRLLVAFGQGRVTG